MPTDSDDAVASVRAVNLIELLQLSPLGDDQFRAPMSRSFGPRLFGGLVAAQSLRAACDTLAAEHLPQSLHAYFILPGNPDIPLEMDVERTRDGRSFSTRRVTARQNGAAIFEMIASFHKHEEGADWSIPSPVDAPDPELLTVFNPEPGRPSATFFELRPLKKPQGPFSPPPYWVRTNEDIGDDPLMHACVLTYISDMGILAMARPPGQGIVGNAASLDHAIWFHRPFDIRDWLLFTGAPRSNFGGRGLAVGGFHKPDGTLVASVVQEGLFRPPR